jgi:predicted TIM-barrel fold metal-dependent hydrolase
VTAHRIDVHHHILPPAYVAAVGEERIRSLAVIGSGPKWHPQDSIDLMERYGIAVAINAISAPGLWFGDDEAARRLARICNEYAAGMSRDYPRRFGSFAALPLPDVDGALAEAAYALDTLKAEGVCLLTNYGGRYPGDAAFAPLFDELNRRKAIVCLHPTVVPCSTCLPEMPVSTLEFPFDTTRAVTSLLYSGTLARCPDIRFIIPHAGGTVPYLAERIARPAVRPEFKDAAPRGVLPELGRLYFDLALSANPRVFSALRQLVPMSNILFGSDYPFAPEPTTPAMIAGIQSLGLSAAEVRAIERDNALTLMPHLAA